MDVINRIWKFISIDIPAIAILVALLGILLAYRSSRNSTAPAVVAGAAQYDGKENCIIVAIKNPGLGPAYFVKVDALSSSGKNDKDDRFKPATIAIIAKDEGFGIKHIDEIENHPAVAVRLRLQEGCSLTQCEKQELSVPDTELRALNVTKRFAFRITYQDSYKRNYTTVAQLGDNSLIKHKFPGMWEDFCCFFRFRTSRA